MQEKLFNTITKTYHCYKNMIHRRVQKYDSQKSITDAPAI